MNMVNMCILGGQNHNDISLFPHTLTTVKNVSTFFMDKDKYDIHCSKTGTCRERVSRSEKCILLFLWKLMLVEWSGRQRFMVMFLRIKEELPKE